MAPVKTGYAGQGSTSVCSKAMLFSGSQHTFNRVVRGGVLVIVQKTTGIELVAPTQYLLFDPPETGYRKRNKFSYQDII